MCSVCVSALFHPLFLIVIWANHSLQLHLDFPPPVLNPLKFWIKIVSLPVSLFLLRSGAVVLMVIVKDRTSDRSGFHHCLQNDIRTGWWNMASMYVWWSCGLSGTCLHFCSFFSWKKDFVISCFFLPSLCFFYPYCKTSLFIIDTSADLTLLFQHLFFLLPTLLFHLFQLVHTEWVLFR